MIKDAYVQYQSRKAAKDLFDAMELLPGRVKMERDVHYIDDKTAAMNLHLVLMMAALHGQKRPDHPAQHRPGPGAYGSRQNSFIPSSERLFTLPPCLPSASWENTSPGNALLLPEHPTGETAGPGPDFTP